MKIDAAVAQFDLPDGYLPTTMILEGPEDARQPLTMGPSAAKEQVLKHKRLVSISFARAEVDVATEAPLKRALQDVVGRVRAKVAEEKLVQIPTGMAIRAELQHIMTGSPVCTFVFMTGHQGMVWSYMLTVIDEPKAKAAGKADFETLTKNLKLVPPPQA